MPVHETDSQRLAPQLIVEDHGEEFYLISEGEGHDLTLSLDSSVAIELAQFILSRRGATALGGLEEST